MNGSDALSLLRAAVPSAEGETWADLGAGTGVFTLALAMLIGPSGQVFAVDEDIRALSAIRTTSDDAFITLLRADVRQPLDLPPLDGVVMANVLHFIADAEAALARIVTLLRPGGRLVLIEYEGRRPGPWVPHPVSIARFEQMAPAAGLSAPRVAAIRPSRYGGSLYAAVAERMG